MVVIYISLMISDVEHPFVCLLAILMSFFGKFSTHIFCPFLTGLFDFRVLCLLSSLQVLDTNPLPGKSLADVFPHSIGCLLVLLMVSFAVQKLFYLMRSQ